MFANEILNIKEVSDYFKIPVSTIYIVHSDGLNYESTADKVYLR